MQLPNQTLPELQFAERRALAVLHFEQKKLMIARLAFTQAETDENTARAKYEAAKHAREEAERPEE